MSKDLIIWLCAGIMAVIGVGFFFKSDTPKSRPFYTGIVSYVYDGDTLKIEGVEKRIRLFGLDAPEKGEKGAEAARNALIRLSLKRRITCTQIAIDRYGRIVGQCVLDDGRDLTRAMIDSGTAKEFCRYSKGEYGGC